MSETTIIPVKSGARAIFAYTTKAKLSDDARAMLVEAGYVPIQVESLADVKLMPLAVHHEIVGDEIDLVSQTALSVLLRGKGIDEFAMNLMSEIVKRRKVPMRAT